MLWKI